MSKEVIIRIRDDIDGSDADETKMFTYDGVHYEIDLSSANVELFDKSMKQFIEASRVVQPLAPAGRSLSKVNKSIRGIRAQRRDIRTWAANSGFQVSSRGSIAQAVIDAYVAANPTVKLLEGTVTSYGSSNSSDDGLATITAQQGQDGLISAADLMPPKNAQNEPARDPHGNPLSKAQREVIRAWAVDNKLDQAWTGRVKRDVIAAYYAANPAG